MTDRDQQWSYLGDGEKATSEEYTFLARLQDWAGYDDAQTQRRKDAWHWLDDRYDELTTGGGTDWSHAAGRADYIDAVLHGYDTLHFTPANYPRDWATDAENVYTKERDHYVSFQSQYDAQTARKTANLNWLQGRRQYVWQLAEGKVEGQDPGWGINHRQQRYDNLQIATHHGSAWEAWQNGSYVYCDPDPDFHQKPPASSDWREKSAKWHNGHLGITESPADSNCDSRSDGIRHAQDTCANGTWLRYQPWCGVWAFMGLYQSGKVKSGSDSWMASVASIEDYARQGLGPFRAWTTDGSKAKKGDLVVLFGRGQHVGTVRDIDSGYAYTWEGNTSSGSGGSQSNGGGSYERKRSRSTETYGYALIRD
jgi:hypothetical protein